MRFKYSVFTVMTPDLSIEKAAHVLSQLGYEGVEWRVNIPPKDPTATPDYWASNRCTLDINNILKEAEYAKALCDRHGLTVSALGTYLQADDEAVEICMQAAKILDCPQIRVNVPNYDKSVGYEKIFESAVEKYQLVQQLAQKYSIRANFEIHMGTICPSAGLARRFAENFDPRYVGAIYDPGNLIFEGFEQWKMGLEVLGQYLAHVHIKNASWSATKEEMSAKKWEPSWAALREGQVFLPDVIKALKEVGYTGWLSVEDFSAGDTIAKLRDNIKFLKYIEDALDS